MKGLHYLPLLLTVLTSPLLAEPQYIERFHDEEHAFVMNPEGEFVPVSTLGLTPPFEIIGKEGGQYLFKGPQGKQYRVYIPEVVTGKPMKMIDYCDPSPVVLSDDYRMASARGVGEECK